MCQTDRSSGLAADPAIRCRLGGGEGGIARGCAARPSPSLGIVGAPRRASVQPRWSGAVEPRCPWHVGSHPTRSGAECAPKIGGEGGSHIATYPVDSIEVDWRSYLSTPRRTPTVFPLQACMDSSWRTECSRARRLH